MMLTRADIETVLRERLETLATALEREGDQTLSAWAAMRDVLHAYRPARSQTQLALEGFSFHGPEGAGAEVRQIAPMACDLKEAEGGGYEILGPAPEPWSENGRVVAVRFPLRPGERLINEMPCAEAARILREEISEVAAAIAPEIETALPFYIEPHLLPFVDLRRVAWAWPLYARSPESDVIPGAAQLLNCVRDDGQVSRESEGLGSIDASPSAALEARAWTRDIRERHAKTVDLSDDIAEAVLQLGRAFGPETTILGPRDRGYRLLHWHDAPVMFQARAEALAKATGADEALRFAVSVFETLASDTAWGRLARHDVAAVALSEKQLPGDPAEALTELADALRTRCEAFAAALAKGLPEAAKFAEHTFGEAGTQWARALESVDAQELLTPTPSAIPARCGLAKGFAVLVWDATIAGRGSIVRFRTDFQICGEDEYGRAPKVMAGCSWAYGGPGVEVGGDHYGQAAIDAGALVQAGVMLPRSYARLSHGHERKPHETALAVLPPDIAAVRLRSATISVQASKLALTLSSGPSFSSGRLTIASLGELARTIYPDAPRIQARELEATARALWELRELTIVLPDDTNVQPFDIQIPNDPRRARADMELRWGASRTFVSAVRGTVAGPQLKGGEYKGAFLYNHSGAMRLPNQGPTFRAYVRTAAQWNAVYKGAGETDLARLPARTLDEWCVATNAASESHLAAMDGKATPAQRVAAATGRKNIRDALEDLDARGLVVMEAKAGRYKALPPDGYLEAQKAALTKRQTTRRKSDRPHSPP